MWNKALLAVAPAALFIAAPAPVHADETCTALANVETLDAYNQCMVKMNVRCQSRRGNVFLEAFVTCKYPDGGRDECIEHFGALADGRVDDLACTYFPPGAP
ncbi:hypothetical protein [Mycobacterium sp. SMC-11]|uniref:hypothetical protein n=1 Tax=Mycobacterium sp. SMC-11 TaxID=3385969 RepID=UPI00390C4D97